MESLYTSFIEPIFLGVAGSLDIRYAYADCDANVNYNTVLKNSELAFTGTVTRLDNYNGPQKVTFFIHDVIKGKAATPKYILENTGKIFHENGSVTRSSVDVDYKIGKTYKVYVENGKTTQCTTKLTAPPVGYMWEPRPEDGNYYSIVPVTCDELFENTCQKFFHYTEHFYTVLPFFIPMLGVGLILVWKSGIYQTKAW